MVQVQDRVISVRTQPTIPENPPAYDPQANGGAERGVHQREIFQELDEREELKTTEALELVQRKHKLIKWERGRESKDFAKVGGVKSNRSVVWSSRQFLLS